MTFNFIPKGSEPSSAFHCRGKDRIGKFFTPNKDMHGYFEFFGDWDGWVEKSLGPSSHLTIKLIVEKKRKVPKGAGWGIGYGIGIPMGLIFGILLDNIAIGIAIGVAIGAGIGGSIESGWKQEPGTPEQKKLQKISMILASIILVIGVLVFLWIYLS